MRKIHFLATSPDIFFNFGKKKKTPSTGEICNNEIDSLIWSPPSIPETNNRNKKKGYLQLYCFFSVSGKCLHFRNGNRSNPNESKYYTLTNVGIKCQSVFRKSIVPMFLLSHHLFFHHIPKCLWHIRASLLPIRQQSTCGLTKHGTLCPTAMENMHRLNK